MIERREKEWQELEQRALQILENPRLLPKDETTKHFKPMLHLWIAPSFTPDKHWIFYKPRPQINPQPKPIIRQIVWERQIDFKRLNDPLTGLKEGFQTEPTFETKTIEIESNIFEALHDQLSKIQLPAFVKDEILGLDGEIFGVETLGFYHHARISWWSVYPKEWQDLVDWFAKTTDFIQNEFSKV